MRIKIAEYKIKKIKIRKLLPAIKKFISEIKLNEPKTFYEVYRKGKTSKFVHLMKFINKKEEIKHTKADYTKKFVEILYPICESKPKFTTLSFIK